MPPTGSRFTDWQQVDAEERRLLMDEDFSWSEPPARSRRRRIEEPEPSRRRTAVMDREPIDPRDQAEPVDPREQVAETQSEFDALMQRWNDAYGDGAGAEQSSAQREISAQVSDAYDIDSFDYDDLARYTDAPVVEDPSGAYVDESGRRTVVITGRGAERYSPPSRRRQASELRFHERSGFNPDRTAMWAVLLGLALLIGCVVH